MKLSWKKNRLFLPAGIAPQKGAALPVVLMFAVFGMIAVLTFLFSSLTSVRPDLRSPTSLQALLNARSGVYRALELIGNAAEPETLKAISAFDSLFGMGLFSDTGTLQPDIDKLEFGGSPQEVDIFSSDSFGSAQVSLSIDGGFCVIASEGNYRETKRAVEARLGSRVPALPDTVLILENDLEIDKKPKGTILKIPGGKSTLLTTDSSTSGTPGFREFIGQYQSDFQAHSDTSFFEPPLTIQSQREFAKIPEIVKGDLFIDGAFFDLHWNEKRHIQVLGDLQITGDVTIENLSFAVVKEIRVLDKAEFRNVSLYAQTRIFIGGDAQFQGNAIALQRIIVYEHARVISKSSFIVAGESSARDTAHFSLLIADQASFDGVALALSHPGGIKTDPETEITGILWAQHQVCHQGTMLGLIKAEQLVDCTDPTQLPPIGGPGASQISTKKQPPAPVIAQPKNVLLGSLAPLTGIADYPMPFFMGTMHIVGWREN